MIKKAVLITLGLATFAFGQRGGVGRSPSYVGPPPRVVSSPVTVNPLPRQAGPINGGFGSVVFPGTGNPVHGGIPSIGPSFPAQLGATVAGTSIPGYNRGGRGRRGGAALVPVPVFVGGYGYGYDYAPPMEPNVTVINQPSQVPSVIINQSFVPDQVKPVIREYNSPDAPQDSELHMYQAPGPSFPEGRRSADAEKPTIYMVAFKDGTIYMAYAFWTEGDTLHYITTRHDHNQASLGLIDVPMSTRLNQERGLEFKIK